MQEISQVHFAFGVCGYIYGVACESIITEEQLIQKGKLQNIFQRRI